LKRINVYFCNVKKIKILINKKNCPNRGGHLIILMIKHVILSIIACLLITCTCDRKHTKSSHTIKVRDVEYNDTIIISHKIDSVSFCYKNYEYLIISVTNDKSDVVGQDIYVFRNKVIVGKIELPFVSYIKINNNNEYGYDYLLNYHLVGIKSDTIAKQEVILLYGSANIYYAIQEFLVACNLDGHVLAYWIANQSGIILSKNMNFFKQEPDEDIDINTFTAIQ
jgi:hypothetical protein